MDLKEAFGFTVKSIRRAKGLPQNAVGINQGYISELESGQKTPTLPKMAAIARSLGIHPLTLLAAVYTNMEQEDSKQLLARVNNELDSLS
ncbi:MULTISPECIES: helix-turn-helix domain-containing protein [Pseudomonas]|uniref:helix-turn-helix domain-containing protein n=1 Tax=Pseudomonas TaxID=286 RepID=UPI000812B484|nr:MULTISPECIES: helix-turn-helix transcriptional regulator [Pseudomonas]MCF5667148.1 helix-turn-helix domain-containing protein [Pseudomonas marginalis]MCF5745663.1 helix-turn-helix domain-containing protein [Pseudomonas tremae]UQB35454.1 helix-turn-helix transcriptional regulator [Pseudomonas tremae]CRM39109.1 transcriptional regulator, y4mF family [Pseudomonas sp. 35 E 8]